MEKGKTPRKVIKDLLLKRLLILLGLTQLLFELESSHLFSWPLDHSCAKSQNLTNVVYLSEKPIRGDDVQANLFSATPEDPFTTARATSLGINYDDIASCYEYPVESSGAGDLEASMDKLENCQHGLYFEQPKGSLSVVGEFNLACSRQQLKLLLLQSIGLGLLAGLVFTCWLVKFYSGDHMNISNDENSDKQSNIGFLVWLLVQLFITSVVLICTDNLNQQIRLIINQQNNINDKYVILLICSFCRSFLTASCLVRILKVQGGILQSAHIRLRETQVYFYTLACIYVTFRALYFPLALRTFINWSNLNGWLSVTALVLQIVTSFYITTDILISRGWSLEEAKSYIQSMQQNVDHQLTTSLTVKQEQENNVDLDDRGRSHNKDNTEEFMVKPNDRSTSPSLHYDQTPIVKVCEFCLVKRELQVHAIVTTMNHNHNHSGDLSGDYYKQSQQANQLDSCVGDDSSALDLDSTYRPTTAPISWSPSLSFSGGRNMAHFDRSGRSTNQILSHVFHHLLSWDTLSRLWLLTFCVSFNYFLFCTLPDHKLLHPESISSRQERKLEHRHALGQNLISTENSSSIIELDQLGLIHSKHENYHYHINPLTTTTTTTTTQTAASKSNLTIVLADYRSINYSTKTINWLYSSGNPLLILWTTARLNGWPLELLVILLHASWISSFATTYFKLNKLMVLIKFGARTLIVEWTIIAILRGQNHLFEVDWICTIALLLAKLSAVLMLYNHFHTMLKLSLKLGTNSLVKLAHTGTCVLVAFLLGSLSPLMEKLNLVIIPILLIINNSLAYLVAKSLNKSFKYHLCPVLFEER